MIYLINYADSRFASQQKLNSLSGKIIGGFDKVFSYGPNDLDEDFVEKNKNILSKERGGGYWIWKPYIILKTLQVLENDDYLFYCDSGSFFLRSIKPIIYELSKLNQSILGFEQPLIEGQWTKKEAFDIVGLDNIEFYDSAQLYGGYILVKKSEEAISFFSNFLELCLNENALIFHPNDKKMNGFLDHRHDQSLFSLLYKK
ncbi:hypothetical protein D0X99_20305, partial [Algoriphagus lacus]